MQVSNRSRLLCSRFSRAVRATLFFEGPQAAAGKLVVKRRSIQPSARTWECWRTSFSKAGPWSSQVHAMLDRQRIASELTMCSAL